MSTRLVSVVVDAAEPGLLACFWADAMGFQVTVDEPDESLWRRGQTIEWVMAAPCA